MNTTTRTKDITLAAVLTAISMLITFGPKIIIGPFTMTLASHVPTMLALFINPFVTLLTVIGSIIGFSITIGPLVAIRAASHVCFALIGYYMIKNKSINIFITIIVTSVLHAGVEAILVYFLTGLLTPAALSKQPLTYYVSIAFFGTLIQHYVDCAITAPILFALKKARMIHMPVNIRHLHQPQGSVINK